MEMKELLDRCEYTIDYQKREIDRLRSEVQRLTDLLEGKGLDAHTCLRNIYTNPESSESNKLKAAASAISFEKPKLSIQAYVGQRDRRTAWQTYECWARKRQLIANGKPVVAGYCDDLKGPDYQPPEGEHWPPKLIERDPVSGYRIIEDSITKPSNGGNGEDHS
jgi:hypothetical protein